MALVRSTKCGHHPVSTTAPKCPRCGAPRYGHQASSTSIQTPQTFKVALERRTSSFGREVPGYAQICGIIAIALAIAGVIVPVIGVLFITPVAIALNAVALWGGYRPIGLITIVIILVNLLISPSFWVNVGVGATISEATVNRFLTYFDIAGVLGMFCVIDWRRRK